MDMAVSDRLHIRNTTSIMDQVRRDEQDTCRGAFSERVIRRVTVKRKQNSLALLQ
jgi:hypothetical protein